MNVICQTTKTLTVLIYSFDTDKITRDKNKSMILYIYNLLFVTE